MGLEGETASVDDLRASGQRSRACLRISDFDTSPSDGVEEGLGREFGARCIRDKGSDNVDEVLEGNSHCRLVTKMVLQYV